MEQSTYRIVQFTDADAGDVFALWRHGFYEMRDDGISTARQRLWFHLLLAACLCAVLFALLRLLCAVDAPPLLAGCAAAALCWELVVDRLGWPPLLARRWHAAVEAAHHAVFWHVIPLVGREMTSAAGIRSQWMRAGHASFWVARSATGDLLGAVACRLTHTLASSAAQPPGSSEASVWRLVVAPAARKLGVGRSLMAVAEQWARQHGASHLTLLTGNEASKQFYRRIGYTIDTADRTKSIRPALPRWKLTSSRLHPQHGTLFVKSL